MVLMVVTFYVSFFSSSVNHPIPADLSGFHLGINSGRILAGFRWNAGRMLKFK
jgi:hypothetical protein